MTKQSLQALIQQADNASMLAVEGAKLDFALDMAKLLARSSLSRSDLAARLDVSLPMVTKILRGDSNLTIETMVKAARAARGKLHFKLTAEDSHCRWFEVLTTERRNATRATVELARPQGRPVNVWNGVNVDDTESAAA